MGKKGKKAGGPPQPGIPRLGPNHPFYDVQRQEDNIELTKSIETLERELLVKQRIEENARAVAMQLRDKCEQMQEDFKAEQKCTFSVTADMARSYKALQEDLIHKINSLETTLTEQKEELDLTRHELKELCMDKDDIIAHKDRVISELKIRTEQMCVEFQDMLSTTLKLMKSHMAMKLENPEGAKQSEDALQKTRESYVQKLAEFSNKAVSVRPP